MKHIIHKGQRSRKGITEQDHFNETIVLLLADCDRKKKSQ